MISDCHLQSRSTVLKRALPQEFEICVAQAQLRAHSSYTSPRGDSTSSIDPQHPGSYGAVSLLSGSGKQRTVNAAAGPARNLDTKGDHDSDLLAWPDPHKIQIGSLFLAMRHGESWSLAHWPSDVTRAAADSEFDTLLGEIHVRPGPGSARPSNCH